MSNAPVEVEEATIPKAKGGLARRLFSLGIDFCLIVLAGIGGYYAIQSSWKKSEHIFHLNQLADKTRSNESGTFKIKDPDRIHVKAIETGKPLEFAWHVYLPTGFKSIAVMETLGGKSGKMANTTLTEPSYSIARFKLKLLGEFVVCEQHWLGEVSVFPSNLSKSRETREFLEKASFDDAISQAGKVEVQTFSKDDDVDLLKLLVPTAKKGRRPDSTETVVKQFSFCLRDRVRSSRDK